MRLLGGMVVGSLAGRRAARRQFEAMQNAQAQQEQINQAQTQAAQAQQMAQELHRPNKHLVLLKRIRSKNLKGWLI